MCDRSGSSACRNMQQETLNDAVYVRGTGTRILFDSAADSDLPPFGNEQVHLCFEATGRQTGECVSACCTLTHKPKSKEGFRSKLSDITPEQRDQV